MNRWDFDIYHAIPIVFADLQVCDDNGYINGFDDRIHALDKEERK